CGTFFSSSDVVGRGCVDRLVWSGLDLPQGDPDLTGGFVHPQLGSYVSYIVRARQDKEASDSGQFGVAFRWFVPELNNTEFGFYALNYHSRNPLYSNIKGGLAAVGQPEVIGIDGALGAAGYFFEYPEDIQLYGISFGTDIGGMSVAGELSYRPNMPIQINSGDMSRAALADTLAPGDNTHRGNPWAAGDYMQGYQRKEFWQATMSAVHFIDRVMGASRLALIGEVGANYISGIEGNGPRFGRDCLFGQSPWQEGEPGVPGTCSSTSCAAGESPRAGSWCENDGFFTDFSWGYRLRASLDYSNVFAGVNLSPNIAWSHDVKGYSPNFVENAKSVSLGVNADYANKYNASLSYTNFFDGKYNTLVDRDFAAISFGVSF